MAEIKTLNELRNLVGIETVNHLFVEYFLEITAKSRKLDDMIQAVNSHKTTEEIEAILWTGSML